MAEVDIDDNDTSDNGINMTLTYYDDEDDVVLYASRIETSKDANDIQRIIEAMQWTMAVVVYRCI